MIVAAARVTAEWICSRCGSTNRKWVLAGSTSVKDRCVSCHAKHTIAPNDRPVRWTAQPA